MSVLRSGAVVLVSHPLGGARRPGRSQQVSRGRHGGQEMCGFYRDHQQGDAAHDLAQYVSLALNLGAPPDFAPKLKKPTCAGRGYILDSFSTEGVLRSATCTPSGKSITGIPGAHRPISRPCRQYDYCDGQLLRMPMSAMRAAALSCTWSLWPRRAK